jgi:hypothetical protein
MGSWGDTSTATLPRTHGRDPRHWEVGGTASSRMRQQYAAVNPARLRRDQGRRPEARDYRLENSYTGAGTSASPVQGGHLGSGR